ncbi:MAG: hypothetical protein PUB34_05490 [Clostridia bacterium]|nr:hypothetical protein [Clostridia bacterium]
MDFEISNSDRLKKQQELKKSDAFRDNINKLNNKGNGVKNQSANRSAKTNAVVRRKVNPVAEHKKHVFHVSRDNLIRAVQSSIYTGKNDAKLKTVKASKRIPFPMTALVMTLIVTGLFMFLIMSYVQINEYTLEVSKLRSDLSSLQSERKDLTYQLDEKNDMLAIEQYATENLHMVKLDQLTKKHITIDREDKIEVVETEPTEDKTVVTTVMSAFLSNFTGLLEYLQ